MFTWFKTLFGKKCPVCDTKMPKKVAFAEIRLETAEGLHTVECCPDCSRFFEMSAKVLNKWEDDDDDSI
jgi:hypothetical protein